MERGIGASSSHGHTRLRVSDISMDWFDRRAYSAAEFHRDFHITKATFNFLCHQLDLEFKNIKSTKPEFDVSTRTRVGIFVWRIATRESTHHFAHKFRVSHTYCNTIVMEVCRAINLTLMEKYMHPLENDMGTIQRGFHESFKIPNIAGALYTTHFSISPGQGYETILCNEKLTARMHAEGHNKKVSSYTIAGQGLVDDKGLFREIYVGHPGSAEYDEILRSSYLWERGNGGILNGAWVVGHTGYPLMDWLLVPYTHQNLRSQHQILNDKLSEVQLVAKRAFEKLKRRWGLLQNKIMIDSQLAIEIVEACVTLHNICEVRNDHMHPQLNQFNIYDDVSVAQITPSANAIHRRDELADSWWKWGSG